MPYDRHSAEIVLGGHRRAGRSRARAAMRFWHNPRKSGPLDDPATGGGRVCSEHVRAMPLFSTGLVRSPLKSLDQCQLPESISIT
jgi:hypothetical protein